VSLRAIAIALVVCGILAAALVWSTDQLHFETWLRFTLVAFSAVYLFIFFKNRSHAEPRLDGERN